MLSSPVHATQSQRRPSLGDVLSNVFKRRGNHEVEAEPARVESAYPATPIRRDRRPSLSSVTGKEPRSNAVSQGSRQAPPRERQVRHRRHRPRALEPDPLDLPDMVEDFLAILDEDEIAQEPYLRGYFTALLSRYARWQARGRSKAACFEAACLGGARYLEEIGRAPSDRTNALDAALARALAGLVVDAVEPEMAMEWDGPVREKAVAIVTDEFLAKAPHERVAGPAKRRVTKSKSGYGGVHNVALHVVPDWENDDVPPLQYDMGRRGSDASMQEFPPRKGSVDKVQNLRRTSRENAHDHARSDGLERLSRVRKLSREETQEGARRLRPGSVERIANGEEGEYYPRRSSSLERGPVTRYRKGSIDGDLQTPGRKSSRDETTVTYLSDAVPIRNVTRRGSRDEGPPPPAVRSTTRNIPWEPIAEDPSSFSVAPSSPIPPRHDSRVAMKLQQQALKPGQVASPQQRRGSESSRGESLGWNVAERGYVRKR
ncbi:uncharacterized protein SPPG_05121 [Spizellomyces punctatus DAOM BR117]|uniref:Uncharacterized protein n=1 Tax=Spizellomyces punctatus (strain DAOM BR117) TaxID=645134 RepID=A0A0L0HFE2_SPIPD|nr:uncharacterized protein SPPG_05121 [Spizellomyces punctatus DAOM BR117]KNC99741.1 hypothetical protein SPPG_05121 [Spizellomyces punctatus DAOM BR117]|eukprot:XP_016607781.1 hypothetical protein SPPG_05121 [Spizellomyces punctatus DAOM BR117]